jgi:putative hydrolase of the HAD superfamily
MLNINLIKGIIFDYGGTIDSNGTHWAEVLWNAYTRNNVPVSMPNFRNAYVYGERYLALHPVIQPDYTFKEMLLAKTEIQLKYLKEQNFLPEDSNSLDYSLAISNQCYNFVLALLENVRPILKALASRYPLVLVSNFYGNIEAVLKDFQLDAYFRAIVESAVVGIRKPDPAIFALGVEALCLSPEEVVVIGDSYRKDIFPSASIGCRTIWLKGQGWDEEQPSSGDVGEVIDDLKDLNRIFNL